MFRSEVKINTICTYALPCLLGTAGHTVIGLASASKVASLADISGTGWLSSSERPVWIGSSAADPACGCTAKTEREHPSFCTRTGNGKGFRYKKHQQTVLKMLGFL